jgi:hypothetical protein
VKQLRKAKKKATAATTATVSTVTISGVTTSGSAKSTGPGVVAATTGGNDVVPAEVAQPLGRITERKHPDHHLWESPSVIEGEIGVTGKELKKWNIPEWDNSDPFKFGRPMELVQAWKAAMLDPKYQYYRNQQAWSDAIAAAQRMKAVPPPPPLATTAVTEEEDGKMTPAERAASEAEEKEAEYMDEQPSE